MVIGAVVAFHVFNICFFSIISRCARLSGDGICAFFLGINANSMAMSINSIQFGPSGRPPESRHHPSSTHPNIGPTLHLDETLLLVIFMFGPRIELFGRCM